MSDSAYEAEAARTHAAMLKARDPVPKSYPARDKAFREWADSAISTANPPERAFAKAVFVAGWDARKRAQCSGDAS